MHHILQVATCWACHVLLLFALGALPASAEPDPEALVPPPEFPLDQLVARHFTTEEGLPSNVLNRALTSADGYLWITTYGGLARFDGQAFTIWGQREFPALSTNGFLGLTRDPSGRLWVGTQGDGPWWYDGEGLRPHSPEVRLPREVIAMLVDRDGDLWVGLEDFGVYRYHGSEPVPFDHPAIADVPVRELYEDQQGALWFATRGKGVTRLQDGEHRTFRETDGLPSNSVTCLEGRTDGGLWVGSEEGLALIVGEQITRFSEFQGVTINDLLLDRHGSLWLATTSGLMRRNAAGTAFEVLAEGAGSSFGNVTSLTFDHEGSLWLTSSTRGLFQLRQGKFTNYSTRNGLAAPRAHTIHEARPGEFLVGTDHGGLHRLLGSQVSSHPIRLPLDATQVMDIHRDLEDRFWISTYIGLLRLDGTEERLFTEVDGLPSSQVRWSYQDQRGTLWTGTVDGLARQRADGRFEVPGELGPAAFGMVFSMAEDGDGVLYFGTRSGLLKHEPDGDTHLYKAGEDLPGSLVFNTWIDAENVVWIATNGGLARLDGRGLRSLTWREGLPAESIFDVQEDDSGALWMSSALGVLRLPKAEATACLNGETTRVEATLFDDRDGMLHAECTGARKILKAGDGTLWFPTLGGVAMLDPAHLRRNPVAPPVHLTSFKADGEPVEWNDSRTEIPAGNRRLVFDFAALSFRAPSKVQARALLEGFDADWVDLGSERQITYTNLSPGPYTLRVLAANEDGVWNGQGAEVMFHVQPFFHQTSWFAALMGIFFLAVAIGIYRVRVRAIRQHNTRLKLDARERTRLIDELAAKNRELELFAYTASHDLKSPLITIEGFLSLVEQDIRNGNFERMEKDMNRIRGGIQTMGRLLEGLLEVSRIGRTEEASIPVDLGELAKRAVEVCHAQLMASGANVSIAPDLPRVVGSPTRLLQVFQNLLTNAAKFMGNQGAPRIDIGSRLDGTERVIYVQDNGLGIDPQFQERIFGLFDRLDPKQEGNGLGLAIVKRVVEVHGGRVWVESEGVGRGSTFCFTVDPDRLLVPEP